MNKLCVDSGVALTRLLLTTRAPPRPLPFSPGAAQDSPLEHGLVRSSR